MSVQKVDFILKYIIVGDIGVGKSNILLRFVYNRFKDEYKTTIGVDFAEKKTDYNGNTSFIYNQFNEQMNNTVKEAKGEIEAFMEHQIRKIASNAIAEKMDKDGIKVLEEGLKNPVEM